MFNPEKLLGGMLRSGMRGKGVGSLVSGGAALGLLGVAMEAVEHYMNRPRATSPGASPMPPPAPGAGHLPKPPVGGPPPPPPKVTAAGAKEREAVLLIRAMIAAANADGAIDTQERGQIMEKLRTVDLSREEHQFIVHELLAPKEMQGIVNQVKSPEMARQVYAASLLAITVDTEAERQYLFDLAEQLELDSQSVESIHRQLAK